MQEYLEWSLKRFVRARRILISRPPEPLLLSTSRTGESARSLSFHSPSLHCPRSAISCRGQFDSCANEPEAFLDRRQRSEPPHSNAAVFNYLRSYGLIGLLLVALPAFGAVREVRSIGLAVNNLDREVAFFTSVLPFVEVSRAQIQGRESDALLGLDNADLQVAELRLGDEHITLTEHLTSKGQPIPADSRSFDHWFQHIAIVVSDMDKAYEQLRQHKVKHVSTSPQTLPAWNLVAAGIKAFYFRDPEDHVLEIIFFPPGKGDPKWQRSRRGNEADTPSSSLDTLHSPLFLGIDHTAIVVSDTEKSLAFYRDLLGLRVASESENYGVEQEHLNQVFGARLHITALRAEHGPGIELLEYISPPGGRPLPANAKSNDLIFWRTDLLAEGVNDLASKLRERETRFVSTRPPGLSGNPSNPLDAVLVRDPDGHALKLINRIDPSLSTLFNPNNHPGNP